MTLLHGVTQFVGWLIRRILIAAYMVLLVAALVWLPTLVSIRYGIEFGTVHTRFSFAGYWLNLTTYLKLILSGNLQNLPMYTIRGTAIQRENLWALLARDLPPTLIIVGSTLLIALVVGSGFGLLLSRFGTRRRGSQNAGMFANILALSLPEMLVTMALIFLVFRLSRWLGLKGVHVFYSLEAGWTNYLIPITALCLVPIAYIARLTAVSLDSVREELYMRTAMAKGLSPGGVRRHAWRNAFVQVWSGLPALAGMVISGDVIVEWISGVPGIGRDIGQTLRPQPNLVAVTNLGTPQDATYINFTRLATLCIVMLLLYLVIDTVLDGVHRRLDPRLRRVEASLPWYTQFWELLLNLPRNMVATAAAVFWAVGSIFRAPAALLRAWQDSRDARAAMAAAAGTRPPWWQGLAAAFRGNGPLALGTGILLALVLLGILAPLLVARNPYTTLEMLKLNGQYTLPPFPPSPEFPLGSDELGRDVLARLLYGARYTLLLGLIVLAMRYAVALPWGLLAGWRGGIWEWSVRRAQVLFGALPGIAIPAIFLLRVNTMQGITTGWTQVFLASFVVAAAGTPRLAESLRLQTREIKQQPYVEGARAVGASTARVLGRHLVPNLAQRLVVLAVLEFSWIQLILAELGLFHYHVGGQLTVMTTGVTTVYWSVLPDWGSLIQSPVRWVGTGQVAPLLPIAGIFLVVAGCNLVGEGLRRHWRGQDQLSLGD